MDSRFVTGRPGSHGWLTRSLPVLLLSVSVLVAARPLPSAAVGPYSIYELAERSAVVATASVNGVSSFTDGRFLVYKLGLSELLKGPRGLQALELVQDRGSYKPRAALWHQGQKVVLFATKLPNYSLYRENLPIAEYWQWTESHPSQARVKRFSGKDVARVAKGYLAATAVDNPAVVLTFVAAQLSSPLRWIRQDSIAALGKASDLAKRLDAGALGAIGEYLGREETPVEERSGLIGVMVAGGVKRAVPIFQELLQSGSGVAGKALRALVDLGKPPPLPELLAYSKADAELLRAGAAYALGRQGSDEALKRVSEMVLDDPDQKARSWAIEGLGYSPKATSILERVLIQGDKDMKIVAGDSLVRIGNDEAASVLARRLGGKDMDAAVVAIFSLGKWRSPAALRALDDALMGNVDEKVRDLIKSLRRRKPGEGE